MAVKPWNKHRGTIIKLYIKEGRTLEDVRGIMKTDYNFEASIHSYRQHFDIWAIGKYNCKRRPPTPAAPSCSALNNSSGTSDPGSWPTSSCVSQYTVEHAKIENMIENRGREAGLRDVPMYHDVVLQRVLQSCVPFLCSSILLG
ncbi:hypothetical protein BHE90_016128 [Fusarium euwallaceae]|uniref:Clr5 domain-containing protein n=1 Tax=Fusarium euwallaceae TaxID=1147111 RepID=A0A430L1C5_9HYPO|nr:hypothetical protein BHE90_016128 [Fusarium euwallaceae]